MKLIVISRSKNSTDDLKIINQLFECGVERFHLRKPSMSTADMKSMLENIPQHFHNRIVVHSHHRLAVKFKLAGIHLTGTHRKRKFSTWFRIRRMKVAVANPVISTSFHKLGHLYSNKSEYSYIFLGTIFDRLSGNFHAGYNEHSVRTAIERSRTPLIARGGITKDNISLCRNLGFSGVALASAIWDSADPVETWCEILDTVRSNKIITA